MGVEEMALVKKVGKIYGSICKLESLHPCKDVDKLFRELVATCLSPSAIDVSKLGNKAAEMRSNLIKLCGEAEGLLETHYSSLLGSSSSSLQNLTLFPYFSNYLKLNRLEFNILSRHMDNTKAPSKVAFIGSGPLPLSSIVLATTHLTQTSFHNYDVNPTANSKARCLIAGDQGLSGRMYFHTADIMEVGGELREYEVVFLASLVGTEREEKQRVVAHLARYMAAQALLVVRSAHGARAFMYPVVELCDLCGFQVLNVIHPQDEVINSIVVARKCVNKVHAHDNHNRRHISSLRMLPQY